MAKEETEQKWTQMFGELSFGVICYRISGRGTERERRQFFYANDAFYQAIGYTREESTEQEKLLDSLCLPGEYQKLMEQVEQAISFPGKTCALVFAIRRKDGTSIHLQWKGRFRVMDEKEGYLFCSCNVVEAFLQEQFQLTDRLNAVMREKRRVDDIISAMPVGMAFVRGGREYVVESANSEFLQSAGYRAEELVQEGRPLLDYVEPEDEGILEEAMEKCRESRKPGEFELRMRTKDGGMRWQMFRCQLFHYKNAVPYYILVNWDINERKGLEEELCLIDEQYRMLEEVSDDFPLEYDVENRRFRVPQRYHMNGKVPDPDMRYLTLAETLEDICEADRERYTEWISTASVEEMAGSIDYRLNMAPAGKKKSYVWYRTTYRSILGANGGVIRIIGRSYDISADRKIQEELSREMRLDPLTRLLNKVAAEKEITEYLEENGEESHVMFLIDIDDFKNINDTFGHTVGDTVILDIAQAIKGQFRDDDIVGRIGGDEFLVLMKNAGKETAVEKAIQLGNNVKKRLIGDDAVVQVTLSIGMAVFGTDGDDYETLFSRADHAMYVTKRGGKDHFSFAGQENAAQGVDGERNAGIGEEKIPIEQARGNADKDFLNVAFSLLSHARDINGSLNVLLEQIGKRYRLERVTVLEIQNQDAQPVKTNDWEAVPEVLGELPLERIRTEISGVENGKFIGIEDGDGTVCCGCVRYELAGGRIGCMCVESRDADIMWETTVVNTFCELSRVVGVFVSLRNKLREDQNEIRQLQDRDKLTGLYNLEAFRGRVTEAMKHAKEENVYALVHVDINNFSYVNENFGQTVGDSILKEFAQTIVKGTNVLEACRMYSDYFIVLTVGKTREEVYNRVVEGNTKFEGVLRQKYPTSSMTLSTGISFLGNSNEDFESMLESANMARKRSKELRADHPVVYDPSMRSKRDDEIKIIGRFYGALQKGELEMFLQPKFLIGKDEIYGAEALARWKLPGGEILSPARFIPPLENLGYIVDLDFYIFEQLLRAMKRWKDAGREPLVISTNFSRRHFENGGTRFLQRLNELMERYQANPHYIEIEVTESVVIENLDCMKECLAELERLGYRIAIDDFGTGYSSLSVLLEIPANVIKIDKSFTDRINEEEQRHFVSQMGLLIRSAKEEVIFEGIETAEQEQFLKDCGFRYGQGYLFDKPLPMSEFERKYR